MTSTPTLRRLAIEVGVVAAASSLIAVVALQLWRADLRVPFDYGGDALIMATWVKSLVEHGWTLTNPSLGAPGVLEMHDFPQADHLHLLIMKAASLFTDDWALVFNWYFLLGFPLIAGTAFVVLRLARISAGPAAVAALLFAFLPTRLLKGEVHLFLSSFFQIPLGVLVALWVFGAAPPLVRPAPGMPPVRRRSIAALAACAVVATTGLYFAFFTCFLIAVAGAWAALRRRTWRNAASAAALIGVIVVGLGAGALPVVAYHLRQGPNPQVATRRPHEAEILGLKVVQLVLPATGHRVRALRRLKARYEAAAPLRGENTATSLGAAGSVGFLALLGVILVGARGRHRRDVLLGRLAVLNLAAVLLGTLGGFGSVFAWLVTPQIRTYSRISVVIGFLSLAALAVLLERLVAHPGWRWRQTALAALVAVLVLGLLDQVTPITVRDYAAVEAGYRRDGDLVHAIEASAGPGAMVFQLPHHGFPEAGDRARLRDYDPLRPYLHSATLRWSHPTMRGRRDEAWSAWAGRLTPARLVDTLGAGGFAGVLVDRLGYDDDASAAAVEAALAAALGTKPITTPGPEPRLVYFDVASHERQAHAGDPASESERRRRDALAPPLAIWGAGFHVEERWKETTFRWCSGACDIWIDNAQPDPRDVTLALTLACARTPCRIEIGGDLVSATVDPPDGGTRVERTAHLPAGRRGVVRLRSDAPPVVTPRDPRSLVLRVDDLTIEPVPAP